MKRAVIVLPTYNEAGNIQHVLKGIFKETKLNKEWDILVLVVDSTSEDKTVEIVKDFQKDNKHVHLLVTKKEGLGRAYIQGFHEAIEKLKADVIFEMDADMSHDPAEINNFLAEIDKGADFVIGSRYIKGGSIPEDWGFHRKLFSVMGNVVLKLGFMKPRISEWTNGYRAITVWVIKKAMSHIQNYSGYVFQIALLDNALKNHAQIKEIPIQFKDRTEGVSKINFSQYIVNIFTYIFAHSPFVKFVIVGGTGFIIDSTILWTLVHTIDILPTFAKLISAESAIISNYTLNNFWSFAHKQLDSTWHNYFKGLIKFNIVSSGNIVIQTIGITVLTHFFGTQLIVLFNALIIFIFVIPYSYPFLWYVHFERFWGARATRGREPNLSEKCGTPQEKR